MTLNIDRLSSCFEIIEPLGRTPNFSLLCKPRESGVDQDGSFAVVEFKPFTFDLETSKEAFSEDLVLEESNDIYYQYSTRIRQLVKVKVTFPASSKNISKVNHLVSMFFTCMRGCRPETLTLPIPLNQKREGELLFFRETPELYERISKSYFGSVARSDTQWVDNLLEGSATNDEVWFRDPHPDVGLILVPDFNWNRSETSAPYLLAIVNRRDLRSIRDLERSHVPLLRNVLDKGYAYLKSRFDLEPFQICAFFHYYPTFFHLHVHFVSSRSPNYEESRYRGFRVYPVEDIIEGLERSEQFCKETSFHICISRDHHIAQTFISVLKNESQ